MVSQWIQENILDKGIDNVRFFAQMNRIRFAFGGLALCEFDNTTWVECKVNEDRYKVEEGYKITLVPLDGRFTSSHYYQTDFESLIRSGCIFVKDSEKDYVKHVKWAEPCGSMLLIHEADMVVQEG